jgi:amidase
METLTRDHVCYVLSRENRPALTVQAGESFCLETEDAYGGAIAASGDKFPAAKRPNPCCGPVFVAGAAPKTVLRVDIEKIVLKGAAAMSSPDSRVLPIRAGRLFVCKGLSVPVSTMVGVIGTTPRLEPAPTTQPGEHGGNMDCPDVREGTAVFLPVQVEGGLLAAGDVHALMGDGEVCGCGAEVAADVIMRATVVEDRIPTPCIETPDALVFPGSAATLDECEYVAVDRAHRFLTDWLNVSEKEALRLMGLMGDLKVCQVVNEKKTMSFSLPKTLLNPLGLQGLSPFGLG